MLCSYELIIIIFILWLKQKKKRERKRLDNIVFLIFHQKLSLVNLS